MYSKWPKLMPMSGITSAWPLYEMATATEAGRWPSPNMGLARADWSDRLAGNARFGHVTAPP